MYKILYKKQTDRSIYIIHEVIKVVCMINYVTQKWEETSLQLKNLQHKKSSSKGLETLRGGKGKLAKEKEKFNNLSKWDGH